MRKVWVAAAAIGALTACRSDDPGECGYEAEPITADGTLTNEDTCTFWELAVGDHLVVNVQVSVEDPSVFPGCNFNDTEFVVLNSSPIYSNLEGQGAKWTFDWVGETASAGAYDEIAVTCDDGTTWEARVEVVE